MELLMASFMGTLQRIKQMMVSGSVENLSAAGGMVTISRADLVLGPTKVRGPKTNTSSEILGVE
jgi:hypothetical protein